jgi:hypothetical protein
MNLAWLNDHHGSERPNWLSQGFDESLVAGDLDVLAVLGIRIVRAFCPLEAVMSYDGNTFSLDAERSGNLHKFLDAAAARMIAVAVVMGDGHVDSDRAAQSLDGKFRWELVVSPAGIDVYRRAVSTYVKEFARHTNVMFWELHSEPYGNLTWSSWPQRLGVTPAQAHNYLTATYRVAKELVGSTPVGISDLEEEQQDKYKLFSVPSRRAALVDDCSDVYAMHVYRETASQLADFTGFSGKPKWCLELGAYNYNDPTGVGHNNLPAHNELYDEHTNAQVFEALGTVLAGIGFELLMPWSMADNGGMFIHQPNGTHLVKELPRWMAGELLAAH